MNHSNQPIESAEPINTEALMQRCMGEREFAASIANQFVANWDNEYTQLEQLVEQELEKELTQCAHRLKGNCRHDRR